ncbi:LytR/AlgR family response regulator transcription factor [Rubrivirga sp.]|uniref:LytR/AlgR family response regulator transcription factor n=1 Tax=Rubrivirga sp. TaxID=1885344 RepID=UPI003B52B0F5
MSEVLRVALVDDEPPARALLTDLLADLGGVEVVGQAADGEQAVALVEATRDLDVLFLDVQMPRLDGFGVLARLAARGVALPRVVFTTAFDRHAVQAFETGAVDYLLKPVTRSRLTVAVERARTRRALDPADARAASEALRTDRVLVRAGDRLVAVAMDDVVWVEAQGNYATLHTTGRSLVAGVGIGEIERRLPPGRFVRVHRSALVALDALRQLESDGSGGYQALLDGGHRVRVSRTYADEIRRRVL